MNPDDPNLFCGYFSAKACEQFGYSIYTTYDGSQVQITAAFKNFDIDYVKKNFYHWDDVVLVGPLTRFVKSYRGTYSTSCSVDKSAKYIPQFRAS